MNFVILKILHENSYQISCKNLAITNFPEFRTPNLNIFRLLGSQMSLSPAPYQVFGELGNINSYLRAHPLIVTASTHPLMKTEKQQAVMFWKFVWSHLSIEHTHMRHSVGHLYWKSAKRMIRLCTGTIRLLYAWFHDRNKCDLKKEEGDETQMYQ